MKLTGSNIFSSFDMKTNNERNQARQPLEENIDISKISEVDLKNLDQNTKSDLVVKTPGGSLYKLSADEFNVENGEIPDVNTNVEFVGISGKLIYSDKPKPREIQLRGHNSLGLTEASREAVQVREVKADATMKDLFTAVGVEPMSGNNLDEIVVQTDEGKRLLFYADELSVTEGEMPQVGERVSIGDVTGLVVLSQDEVNEEIAMPIAATAVVAVTAVGSAGAAVLGTGAALLATKVGAVAASTAAIHGFGYGVGAAVALAGLLDMPKLFSGALTEDDSKLIAISKETEQTKQVQLNMNQID